MSEFKFYCSNKGCSKENPCIACQKLHDSQQKEQKSFQDGLKSEMQPTSLTADKSKQGIEGGSLAPVPDFEKEILEKVKEYFGYHINDCGIGEVVAEVTIKLTKQKMQEKIKAFRKEINENGLSIQCVDKFLNNLGGME